MLEDLKNLIDEALELRPIKYLNIIGWILIIIILIGTAVVVPIYKVYLWLDVKGWWRLYFGTINKVTPKQAKLLMKVIDEGKFVFGNTLLKKKVLIKLNKIIEDGKIK